MNERSGDKSGEAPYGVRVANKLGKLVLEWLAKKEDKGDTEYHIVKVVLESHGTIDQALRSFARSHVGTSENYQRRVESFMLKCFGPEIAEDVVERNHRFIEEALELVQANGCTAADAHMLVDYVYGRPVGEAHQEAGGVMVTLAALCSAARLDMERAGEDELTRVNGKIEVIREKQKKKPKGSPLPQYAERLVAPSATATTLPRTMDSAPKDKNGCLAYSPSFYQGKGGWVSAVWMENGCASAWHSNPGGWRFEPTHWMPFPDAPRTTDGKANNGS